MADSWIRHCIMHRQSWRKIGTVALDTQNSIQWLQNWEKMLSKRMASSQAIA